MKNQKPIRKFQSGAKVQWNWMGRIVKGTVLKIYLKPISKTLRGFEFKLNGSKETPAYFIKSESGNEVLKLHTELKASK